mgnify:CR=1 FL=1
MQTFDPGALWMRFATCYYANEPPIPHDRWGEEMLLGILTLCPERLPQMPPELSDAWWDSDHRQVYAALAHLGTDATPSKLALFLAPNGSPEMVKWMALISKCISETPFYSPEHMMAYVRWVIELAGRRHRMEQGAKMVVDAWAGTPERGSTVKARVKDAPRMEGDARRT